MSLDQPSDFVKHQTTTRDAFLGGRITLSQPRHGFRAGFDSVLLGAAVRNGTKALLDLGAGVGTAGLVALALGQSQNVTLVERHEATVDLARSNIADNALSDRANILNLDLLAPAPIRRAAGLKDNSYDSIIANPPFFGSGQGTLAPDSSRAEARHMAVDALDAWVRCAAGAASGSGEFIIIYPAAGLADLLGTMEKRFGALTILPLAPRVGQAVTRILIRGIKGSRAPLTLLSTRALHTDMGRDFAPEFDAIFRGEASLVW